MTEHRTADERRTQIRRAALAVFARKGYVAARIDDVAEEAGLSKGAVYWHYASKKALFADLVADWFRRSAGIVEDVRGRGAREALRAAAGDLVRRRDEMPLLLDFWSETTRDPELRALYNRIYGAMREAWLEILGGPGSEAYAAVLVGAFSGLFVQWLADPEAIDLEEGIEAIFDLADRVSRRSSRRTRGRTSPR